MTKIKINPNTEHAALRNLSGCLLDKDELEGERPDEGYPAISPEDLNDFSEKAYNHYSNIYNDAHNLDEWLAEDIEERIGTELAAYITKLTYYTNPQLTIEIEI